MRNTKYEKIADNHKAKEDRGWNAFIAFVSGGVMGFMAEAIIELLCFYYSLSRVDSATIMIVIFIQ